MAKRKTTKKNVVKPPVAKKPVKTKPMTKKSSGGKRAGAIAAPTYEQIAARAYELYVRSGYAQGRDAQNWREAERQLMGEKSR